MRNGWCNHILCIHLLLIECAQDEGQYLRAAIFWRAWDRHRGQHRQIWVLHCIWDRHDNCQRKHRAIVTFSASASEDTNWRGIYFIIFPTLLHFQKIHTVHQYCTPWLQTRNPKWEWTPIFRWRKTSWLHHVDPLPLEVARRPASLPLGLEELSG